MAASDAAAELLVKRFEPGRRHITRAVGPRIAGERSIELPVTKERFEFDTERGGHDVSLLFRLLGEYSAALLCDQVKVGYPCK